ncbi:MAG: phosphatase PAP2 family protein [Cyclobacteriaceae bacterium]|nr:phosphatase PAP2 family protein [Cyclobacteriaceae bacterium]
MKLKACLLSLALLNCLSLCAQTDSAYLKVYHTNPKLEIPIPAVFFCGAYFGFKALDKHASFTEADVLKLDPASINSFDRPVAFYDPANFASAQSTSDLFLNVAVASPVLLLLDKRIRKDWVDLVSIFLVTHAADNAIYFAAQASFRRARPLTYNPDVALEDKIGEGKTNSFFSGHTSWTAASTFLMAKMYTDYRQIKGFKRILIYTGAAIPPALVGYYRMEAGKHFKSDVMVGFLVGAACGIGIPELHRIKIKDRGFSLNPFFMGGSNGVSVTYTIQ